MSLRFRSQFDLDIETTDEKQNESIHKTLQSIKTGTTTVGLICKDGVVLATDKRATAGFYVASKTAEKLHMIQPYIWMTIAGSVADAQNLIDVMRAETNLFNLKHDSKMSVKAAAKDLCNILYNQKGQYEVGFIVGGYTPEEGPCLYDVDGYGSILPEKFASVGSGSVFAIGVLEAKYSDDLTVKKGMDIAMLAVRSALLRDIATGNGIDVVGITKDGYERKFYSIEKDPIAKK